MDLEKPRFRHDLVARPLEDAGIFYVDVSDPDSGKQFRFYDVEYSIACAMDGDRNLQGLVDWTRSELGVDTSVAELRSVVSTLAGLGYLDGAAPQAVEVVDLTTDVKPPPPAGMSFGDDEMTRPALNEMDTAAAAMASDQAMGSMPIDDDFAMRTPTAAGQAADDHAEFQVIREGAVSGSIGGDREDSVTTQLPMATSPAIADDPLEMDLSAHVAVDKNKLAEAVKLSRAISVPTAAEVEAAATAPASEAPAAFRRESAAVKLPEAPPAAASPAAAAAVEPKSSPMVLVVSLLLLALAGGLAYYFLVYKQPAPDSTPAPKVTTTTPASGEAPRAPTLPKGRVASSEATVATIAAPGAAAIEWTVVDGKSVTAEEVIAKLAGAKRLEGPLLQAKDRLAFYQGELSRAAASNKLALVTQLQKKVDEKQGLVDQAAAALEPLLVRAPVAGPIQVLAVAGSKIAAGDPIARIAPKDFVFTVAIDDAPVGLVVGAPVKLATAADTAHQLVGVVDKVAGARVVVRLVPPVDVKPGEELVLLAP